jgi:hypothetical protein
MAFKNRLFGQPVDALDNQPFRLSEKEAAVNSARLSKLVSV